MSDFLLRTSSTLKWELFLPIMRTVLVVLMVGSYRGCSQPYNDWSKWIYRVSYCLFSVISAICEKNVILLCRKCIRHHVGIPENMIVEVKCKCNRWISSRRFWWRGVGLRLYETCCYCFLEKISQPLRSHINKMFSELVKFGSRERFFGSCTNY